MRGITAELDGRERMLGRSRSAALLGLWLGLAASTVLFAGLVAAAFYRRAFGEDWTHMPVPGLVWINTLVLAASSMALELARRRLHLGRRAAFTRLWVGGTALGALFVAGQLEVWRELAAAGIYVASNPGSGFFYVLTAIHGAHLVGGLLALSYVAFQAARWQLGPVKRTAADVCAWFWHYLDGLWLALLALFSIW